MRLPDIGGDTPRRRDVTDDAFDILRSVAQSGSRDAAVDGLVDRGLAAGVDAARDSGLPFIGNLQGSVRWNDANNAFDIDLLTMLTLKGNGEGHHWLLQFGAHNFAQRLTTNTGLVYRWVDLQDQWLIGGNVFVDHDFDGRSSRSGVGAEVATPSLRAFGNVYAPMGGWKVSPDDGLLEERAARGFDLGLAWTPTFFDIFDLQAKGSRWQGDAVDVFGNGQAERDPTVWSLKASLQPVPAIGVSAEHRKIEGGGTDSIVALTLTHRFGEAAASQYVRAPKGQRNDLGTRALLPVEREKRIVMETRERNLAPSFASATATLSIMEGQSLLHALAVSGGVGGLHYSLSGTDAGVFSLSGNVLVLPAQNADAPADAGADNIYDVVVTVTDANGRSASQAVRVEVQSAAPTAQNARITGFMDAPAIGNVLGVSFDYHSPIGETQDGNGLKVEWFRQAPIQAMSVAPSLPVIIAEGPQYTVVDADAGHRIGVRITVKSAGGKTNLLRPVVVLSEVVAGQAAAGSAPTITGASISGTLLTNETVTAVVEGYADADGDAAGDHLYQWYYGRLDGALEKIDGATGPTHVVRIAEQGRDLFVEVTPRSQTGLPATGVPVMSSASGKVAGRKPVANPTMTGEAVVGGTLLIEENYFDADGDQEGGSPRKWYRASDVSDRNTWVALPFDGGWWSDYVVTDADVDHFIVFELTPRAVSGVPNLGDPVIVATPAAVVVPGHAPTMGKPRIDGVPANGLIAGTVLTAVPQGFHDADQDGEGTHRYQWYRATDSNGHNVTAIANATSPTYTVAAGDAGSFLVVDVTPVSAMGLPSAGVPVRTVTPSPVTGSPPTIESVTFTGPMQVGGTLRGVVNGFNDVDGDQEGTHLYQWFRATDPVAAIDPDSNHRTPIAGANTIDYAIQTADTDHYLVLQVKTMSASGTPINGMRVLAVTSGTVAAGTAPWMARPRIDGVPMDERPGHGPKLPVGTTLTAVPQGYADHEQDPEGEHQFQWYRTTEPHLGIGDDPGIRTPIEGANAATYTVQDTDVGFRIGVGVKPVSASGLPSTGIQVTGWAVPNVYIHNDAPTLASVRIEGSPVVGDVVRAVAEGYFDTEGDEPGNHLHAWFTATDAAGTQDRTYIMGANQDTLTVRSQDVGRYLFAQIKPASLTGSGTLTGSPVVGSAGLVENGAGTGSPPSLGSVAIGGHPFAGQTLQAIVENFHDPDGDL